jgi:hypothetical protein
VIWGASPQMRCERKKDRVEVNPELLAAASAQAEISFFCSLYTVQFREFGAVWIESWILGLSVFLTLLARHDGHHREDYPGHRLVPLPPAYHCPAFPCR